MTKLEQIIELDKIKDKLIEYAYTDKAKEEIRDITPYMSESKLKVKLRETTEARLILEKQGNPPMTSLVEIKEYIQLAKVGGCLNGSQLETVAATLNAIKRLKDYMNRAKVYDVSLPYYEENICALDEVRKAIEEHIRDGKVADYASKLLKSLRADISINETKMREKAETVIRSNKEYMSDLYSTERNGHICIPVKKEYKYKIKGAVIDKSSTGNTLFIEPEVASRYYSDLQLLKLDEENEVRRILYFLTDMLADSAELMEQNSRAIEKLDFIFAKGKLSMDLDGVEPRINTERRIVLVDGRHPLMPREINVPLQFKIGDGINGIIITGPNTGGKTVAIKTVALNAIMAQCGLHVTCKEADICMNNAYLCDIGDGQNISENLSTFSAHITNVLDILRQVNRDSLVIMDELGSGTDPIEGMGIAITILEELKKSGALYLVTTHYPEVKNYAKREEGVVNARMTFDKESLKPMYQLVIGEAGESCAFFIANKLGMPAAMINRAMVAAYGEEKRDIPILLDNKLEKEKNSYIRRSKQEKSNAELIEKYNIGDSVMIYPDKKIGIVCKTIDNKGILQVQLPNKKIYINHKRVKLQVPANKLYPEDYDFSIIFDTVEVRKLRHKMERKYVEDEIVESREE